MYNNFRIDPESDFLCYQDRQTSTFKCCKALQQQELKGRISRLFCPFLISSNHAIFNQLKMFVFLKIQTFRTRVQKFVES